MSGIIYMNLARVVNRKMELDRKWLKPPHRGKMELRHVKAPSVHCSINRVCFISNKLKYNVTLFTVQTVPKTTK